MATDTDEAEGSIAVRRAQTSGDFAAIAVLMQEFVKWHYERHASDRQIIDSYFDPAALTAELNSLPGYYGPPKGALLVAEDSHGIVGCAALRELAHGAAEMKRMFVARRGRGRGIGRLLAEAIVEEAKRIGYAKILLDTGPKQHEAVALYRSLGFKPSAPYYKLSPELQAWLVFMQLEFESR